MTMTNESTRRVNSLLMPAANTAINRFLEESSGSRHESEAQLLSPTHSASLPFSSLDSRPSFAESLMHSVPHVQQISSMLVVYLLRTHRGSHRHLPLRLKFLL